MFDNATRLPTNVLQPVFTDDSYTILEHACKCFFGLKTSLTAKSETSGMGPKTDWSKYLKNKRIKTEKSRSRPGIPGSEQFEISRTVNFLKISDESVPELDGLWIPAVKRLYGGLSLVEP